MGRVLLRWLRRRLGLGRWDNPQTNIVGMPAGGESSMASLSGATFFLLGASGLDLVDLDDGVEGLRWLDQLGRRSVVAGQ